MPFLRQPQPGEEPFLQRVRFRARSHLGTTADSGSNPPSRSALDLAKVTGGYLVGGLHLALLRHLWVENVRAHDPDLVVIGGQTHFDDSWWRPLATLAK